MTPEEALAEARRRIASARESHATWLDLGDLGLAEIPPEIEGLSKLRVLALGRRGLRESSTGLQWEWSPSRPKPRIQALTQLRGLDDLAMLSLMECGQLTEVSALSGLTALDLCGCDWLADLSALSGLAALTNLNLNECGQLTDLSSLSLLTTIKSLQISNCNKLKDVSYLSNLTYLTYLNISQNNWLTYVSALSGLIALTSLDLIWCERLADVSALSGLTALTSLDLSRCKRLTDVSALSGLAALTSLKLSRCERLADVSALSGLTALTSLDLSDRSQLTDVSALSGLIALTSLDLSGCERLADVSALSGLTALTSLDLSRCERLADVSALSGLTLLSSLNLSECYKTRTFSPLRPLLNNLTVLRLSGCSFDDLDRALQGEYYGENVLDKVRSHYRDAEFQATADAEFKLFLLGNGGVGKTQLRRRLCGLPFDPSIPTTHGVEIQRFTLKAGNQQVYLNIWDFGGQDIYHGTHALFLKRHAVHVILWMPGTEAGTMLHDGLVLRNRPLSYWLDFVRSVAGTEVPVLIVQSQFDDSNAKPAAIAADHADFPRARKLEASAREEDGLERLLPELKRSVTYLLKKRPIPVIGAGRVRVREQLRKWLTADRARPAGQRKYRTLSWKRFVKLCEKGNGDVSSPEALADFLHQTGFLFYDPGLFHGEIILDQGWALEAIYAVFHRDKSVRQLRQKGGQFTREDLGDWLWDDAGHGVADQERFLRMMLDCGICFRIRKLTAEGERSEVWQYAAPDHLPTLAEFEESHPSIELPDPMTAMVSATLPFRFLHDGLLRSLLARIGEIGKTAADYWRYGCYFRNPRTNLRFRFDSTTTAEGLDTAGSITFGAWGEQGRELIEALLEEVRRLSPTQAVQPRWSGQAVGDHWHLGRRQPSGPEGADRRGGEDPLAELLSPGRPGPRQTAPSKPVIPDSVRMIDAMADLTVGQLGTVATGLGIPSADRPQGDLREQAVEIHRRASLDRGGQSLELLRKLILKYNPQAFD